MASKRRLKRKSCTRKHVYDTQTAAVAASLVLHRKTGEFIQAYKCKYANHWHVGHWKGGTKWTS